MSDSSQIAQEIATLMPQIARRILLKFFQSIDIPQTQLFVIMTLHEKGTCHFRDLSQLMQVSAPTMTGLVDRLETAGYVIRVADKVDRRAINVRLTPQGFKVAGKFQKMLKTRWEEILIKLTEQDRENYLRILKRIQSLL